MARACIFTLASACTPLALAAPASEADMYRVIVARIVKFQGPPRFVIWDRNIASAAIGTPRVPRHLPETQFTRALRGLPPALQANLLSAASDHEAVAPASFAVPKTTSAFTGFVQRDVLRQASGQDMRQDWLLAIGMSRVAYDEAGRNALVYAENCSVVREPGCTGEAYWFVRAGKHWRLKRHAGLWQGAGRPFWEFADHAKR